MVIVVCQQERCFAEPEAAAQRTRVSGFDGRERLIHQRTSDVSALEVVLQ
jgi:transposase